MTGVVHARAGHAVSYLDVGDPFSDGQHFSCTAVSKAYGHVQSAAHCVEGVENSFATSLVEHLPYQVRTSLCLLQHVLLGELDDHSFRAGGDERGSVLHQDVPRRKGRSRHFLHGTNAGANGLEHLFQLATLPPATASTRLSFSSETTKRNLPALVRRNSSTYSIFNSVSSPTRCVNSCRKRCSSDWSKLWPLTIRTSSIPDARWTIWASRI